MSPKNATAKICKATSIIFGAISAIGWVVIAMVLETPLMILYGLVGSFLVSLFLYAIGEIIDLLHNLNLNRKPQSNNHSVAEQLLEYERLKDDGIISEDEYNEKKSELYLMHYKMTKRKNA